MILKTWLEDPAIYLMLQRWLHAVRARELCAQIYVCPRTGQRILDIGCGPGYAAEYFPHSEYVGFDTQQRYIDYARTHYGKQGVFFCQELDGPAADKLGLFDFVVMNGLIHHLDDAKVIELLRLAHRLLKPEGKLVTLDGCRLKRIPWLAKMMLDNDRGRYVRDESSYVDLATRVFSRITSHIHQDWIKFSYPLIVMQMVKI